MGWQLAGHALEEGTEVQRLAGHSAAAVAAAERAADGIAEQDGVALISADQLQALQVAADRQPLYVVAVRLPHEYISGHIPGALTVPGGQLPFSDDQIAVRGARVVTVCDGQARAIFAGSLWSQMGWDVSALDGGGGAWTAAGLALESGGEERPFGFGVRSAEQMVEYLAWEEELGEQYKP